MKHCRGPMPGACDPERRFGPWKFGLPPCLKIQIAEFRDKDEETFNKEMNELCGRDVGPKIMKAARAFVEALDDTIKAADAAEAEAEAEEPSDPELEEAIRQSIETAEIESGKSSPTRQAVLAEIETASLTVPSVSAEEEVTVEDDTDEDSDDGIVKVSAPASPNNFTPAPFEETPKSELATPATTSDPTIPDPLEVWSRVWAKELSVLADMGFHDHAELIPLLQTRVKVPVSLSPELNGVPNAAGMQRVVSVLLSS